MTPAPPASPLARAWAHRLAPDARPLAFVLHDHAVLHAPSVLELVDGIGHAYPDQAHALLRSRVFTTHVATAADRAIVQVCARKLRDAVVPEAGPTADVDIIDLSEAAAASRAHHIDASGVVVPGRPSDWRSLLEVPSAAGALKHRDRPVLAILVDAHGHTVAAARNTNGANRLHHAEVNLLLRLDGAVPPGCTLYVSLQCCRMCAALWVQATPDELAVRYLRPETGRFGTHTALQDRGWEAPMC